MWDLFILSSTILPNSDQKLIIGNENLWCGLISVAIPVALEMAREKKVVEEAAAGQGVYNWKASRQSAQHDCSVTVRSATPPFLTWKTKSKSKTKKKNKSCLEICIAVSTILLRRGATCITIHSRVFRPNSFYALSDSLGMSRLWYEWWVHTAQGRFNFSKELGPSFRNWVSIFRNNGP